MCSVSFPVQNLAHGFRQFCAADGFADETPGIDYGEILRRAEEEADVVVWDGGNNDTPFFRPDVHIVLLDPHRAGHELLYYPGETNLLMAHVAVVNKVDTASAEQVEAVLRNIRRYAPGAEIVLAESPVTVSDPSRIQGRRVLVVEDGPTLTRGEMAFGAGTIAAREFGAARLIDPRPCACGTLKKAFRDYPHMGAVLPALGYSREQIRDLERTIDKVDCDLVLFATPVQLPLLLSIGKPTLRVRYDYRDHSPPFLEDALMERLGPLLA